MAIAAEKGSSMILGMEKNYSERNLRAVSLCGLLEGHPSSAINILKVKRYCLNWDDIGRTTNE